MITVVCQNLVNGNCHLPKEWEICNTQKIHSPTINSIVEGLEGLLNLNMAPILTILF